ncbi:hypothetical protein LCI18_013988 [Fusarium solani-melongenae]|uniref:Uncharacterized protein n=1 Tax=Fusarium solani subsp. cucurbitae TaxID=2747967 RepID=A0ACD3ZSL9_FUSSC|nr:hypothetical protein LCI18_013988 [Fusarium solani-melongenae]
MSSRSRRRAVEACTFCRRRKIKCNGQRPSCANCQTYDKECIYEPVPEVAKEAGRERHQRMKSRSNRHRTNSTDRVRPPSPVASSGGNGDGSEPSCREIECNQQGSGDGSVNDSRPWDTTASTSRSMDAGVARVLVLANGESSYHGRTSALFEDNVQERTAGQDAHPRMPDQWVERGLIAEAARQRQLEKINLGQGKLDFDGVDPDLGMHLLSLHWNRQHHSFLITYRPAFMRDMACDGPYFSKLLLNAIYFGSSKFSPRLQVRKDPNDVRTAGWKYRERVRELLGGSLDRSHVTTIQALLVMANSLFALGDERSAAWLYAGLAFRMLIDLGLHVDLTNSHPFSDEDLEIRRRVFWGAFVVDKIQSLYQGRSVTLKEADAMVPIKFLDTYEELEFWRPFAYSIPTTGDYPGSPAYSVSTFTSLCKLSIAMSDILSCIYTERTTAQSPAELSNMLEKLQLKLSEWQTSLPGHLQADTVSVVLPPPHVLSLHAMYNVLVILLHRPFVADGHLYNTFRSISVDSLMKCASAASSICSLLRAYHRAFSVRRAPYLISYATYVAATIHCRIAAKNGTGSTAYANLMTCLAVFKENQETNSAVQKAAVIIHRLMKKYRVVVDELPQDALEAEPSARQREPQQRVQAQPNYEVSPSSSNVQQNDYLSQAQGTTPAKPAGVSTSPPGSDWIDIDGIIQSFLQENDLNLTDPLTTSFNQPPRLPPALTSGPANLPAADGGNTVLNQPVVGTAGAGLETGSQWQHAIWPSNYDVAFLEDPLFGFNGSSTVEFPYNGK